MKIWSLPSTIDVSSKEMIPSITAAIGKLGYMDSFIISSQSPSDRRFGLSRRVDAVFVLAAFFARNISSQETLGSFLGEPRVTSGVSSLSIMAGVVRCVGSTHSNLNSSVSLRLRKLTRSGVEVEA